MLSAIKLIKINSIFLFKRSKKLKYSSDYTTIYSAFLKKFYEILILLYIYIYKSTMYVVQFHTICTILYGISGC